MKMMLAGAALLLSASAAQAITVDGVLDASYGAKTATVGYDPAAPSGNFSSPSSTSNNTAYNVYFKGDAGYVYGFLEADRPYGAANAFANLYIDIDPSKNDGSDMIIGINANGSAYAADFDTFRQNPISGVQVATTATTFEFAIPNSVFSTPIPGFNYFGNKNPQTGDRIVLRASQSLGYTYVGGQSFGDNRLGATTLAAANAVPEPSAWALMLAGFGALGAMLRRRRHGTVATA